MKKILLTLSIITAIPNLFSLGVLGTGDTGVINLSAVPLSITSKNASAQFNTWNYPSWRLTANKITTMPLSVPSRSAVTLSSLTGADLPGSSQQMQISHKGKTTAVNGSGWWIFSDTGVYKTD